MQDEITLTSPNSDLFKMLLFAIMFVLAGMLILKHPSKASHIWVGYASVMFGGVGGLVSILQILLPVPGRAFLNIRNDCFEYGSFWRRHTFRWPDVEEFGVAEYTTYPGGIPRKHKLVGIRLAPACEWQSKHPTLKRLDQKLFGYDTALPDCYGKKPEELASILNRRKMEYVG